MAKGDKIIRMVNMGKTFHTSSGDVNALDDINLDILEGSVQGIIGLSGAGKSTLVRCINYLEVPTEGDVLFEGQSLSAMSGAEKKKAQERAMELLKLVGLEDRVKNYPSQLSGGQKQRVAIARALATNPKVLLCDEATSALDPKTTKQILDLLKKINQEMGVTVIVITHQMSVIEAICDSVAIIDHSHIAESGPVSEVFSNPKTEIGRRLILGDGNADAIQPVNFGDSKNPKIRIIFDGQKAHRPIISDIVLSCNAPVNILFANTKEVEGRAVGQMVVELPDSVEEAERITHYLRTNDIRFEEVK